MLLKRIRINIWHFIWIAVVLSVLLSLLLSALLHGRALWQYPFSATLIACLVAAPLLYLIWRLLEGERALTKHYAEEAAEHLKTEIALRESQLRFKSAFHDAAIGMALGTLHGDWLMVNPALCDLVGYTEQELMAITYKDITHPDDLDADLALFGKLMHGDIRSYQMEKRYIHKQGHVVWVLLNVSMVRDSSGQPLYCIGQMQDITARKTAQDHLTASQELFRALLDNSPNMIFLKNAEGRYVLVNRQFETAFHLKETAIVGKTDDELFPPSQAASFRENDRKVLETGVPMEFEEVAFHDDGPHTSIVFKFPLRKPDGQICCIGGITADITARKKAEDALRVSEQRLRQAIEDRGRLTQDLHDHGIQSLYAIGMSLETCVRLMETDAQAAARKIQKGIAGLYTLIGHLRDYVEGGSRSGIKAEQLTDALEELVRTIPTAGSFNIELQIDSSIVEELTDHLATHMLHIVREALTNTLRHAKATSSRVSLLRTPDGLHLEVQDNGIGFDPKTKDGHGWGLRNMADRAGKLDAKFELVSRFGGGTRVSLTIPRFEGQHCDHMQQVGREH
jgi:PAS domain S-box-containing protein